MLFYSFFRYPKRNSIKPSSLTRAEHNINLLINKIQNPKLCCNVMFSVTLFVSFEYRKTNLRECKKKVAIVVVCAAVRLCLLSNCHSCTRCERGAALALTWACLHALRLANLISLFVMHCFARRSIFPTFVYIFSPPSSSSSSSSSSNIYARLESNITSRSRRRRKRYTHTHSFNVYMCFSSHLRPIHFHFSLSLSSIVRSHTNRHSRHTLAIKKREREREREVKWVTVSNILFLYLHRKIVILASSHQLLQYNLVLSIFVV